MRATYEKPQPPQDENGIPYINTQFVKGLCRAYGQGMYETPHLNEKLFLHFYGFRKIAGLEEYPNIKTLFLEGNAFSKIENLDHMKNLKCLFLQNNNIKEIKGLEAMPNIHTLNLANNLIKKVEGLSHLACLNNLDLSGNVIEAFIDYEGLKDTPSVEALTLNGNKIDWDERIIDVLKQVKRLKCLYLKDNPIVRNLSYFRKKMINNLEISYLNDQPVWEEERRLARAWAEGGKEAEQSEREKMRFEKNLLHKQYVNEIRKNEEQARQRRLIRMQEQEEDLIRQTEALKKKRAQEKENKRDDSKEKERDSSIEKEKEILEKNRENAAGKVEKNRPKEKYSFSVRNAEKKEHIDAEIWTKDTINEMEKLIEKNEFDFSKTAQDLGQILGCRLEEKDLRLKWKEIEVVRFRSTTEEPKPKKEHKEEAENYLDELD